MCVDKSAVRRAAKVDGTRGFATPDCDNLRSAMLWFHDGRTASTCHTVLAVRRFAARGSYFTGIVELMSCKTA